MEWMIWDSMEGTLLRSCLQPCYSYLLACRLYLEPEMHPKALATPTVILALYTNSTLYLLSLAFLGFRCHATILGALYLIFFPYGKKLELGVH
jgi:hypothetical protein